MRIVPLLTMLPSTVRVLPVVSVTESPALLNVRVPIVGASSSDVAAVVGLITIFSPGVIAPLFQLLALLQLEVPPAPVQVSVVTNGCTLAACERCERLRFAPAAGCAEARPLRLKKVVSRQSTVIHRVIKREDAGRMGDSILNKFS